MLSSYGFPCCFGLVRKSAGYASISLCVRPILCPGGAQASYAGFLRAYGSLVLRLTRGRKSRFFFFRCALPSKPPLRGYAAFCPPAMAQALFSAAALRAANCVAFGCASVGNAAYALLTHPRALKARASLRRRVPASDLPCILLVLCSFVTRPCVHRAGRSATGIVSFCSAAC